MKYLLLLLVLLIFSVSCFTQKATLNSVVIESYNSAQVAYGLAHKAFTEDQYNEALALYEKVDQYIDQNPEKGKYFDHKYRSFSMVQMVRKRADLGKIKPKWEHKVLVVFIDSVSATYQGGRIVTEMEEKYKENAVLACNVSSRYAEVLSKGTLTLIFDTISLKSTVTHIEDMGGDQLVPADRIIYSLTPYPKELIISNINKYDSFLFVWNHKNEQGQTIYKGPHGWGGVSNLAIEPFMFEGPQRGRLLISTGLIGRPGTIFHELFHTLEKCYGIDPIHGFRDNIRKNFPTWKGEGEMDYYQFQFNQIQEDGFDDFLLSEKFPFNGIHLPTGLIEETSYAKRIEARKLIGNLIGNKLESNETVFMQAITLNAYDPKVKLMYAVQLHLAGRKAEAFDQIKDAYKHSPYNAEICYWMGVESYHNKDIEGAIRYLKEALIISNKMSKAQKYLDFVSAKK